jgi:formylmethanofuran--tetrahydromethanopterin N-formyltransferase
MEYFPSSLTRPQVLATHLGVKIDDTYAEAFPTFVSSVIVTAATRNWALKAATEATGFATSCIGCAAEAGIDYYIPPGSSPDGRPGYALLICNPKKDKLKELLTKLACWTRRLSAAQAAPAGA